MKLSVGGRRKNYSKSSNNNSESSENYKIKKKNVRNTISAVGTVGVWYTLGGFFIRLAIFFYFSICTNTFTTFAVTSSSLVNSLS